MSEHVPTQLPPMPQRPRRRADAPVRQALGQAGRAFRRARPGQRRHDRLLTVADAARCCGSSSPTMGWVKPLFLPSPQAVLAKFVQVARPKASPARRCSSTRSTSLYRVFGAFALACLTAIPIGVMMGVSRVARGIFDPPIEFYRPLPPLAYLPLVIIWFGIGEFSKIFLIFLAIFAPMAIAARAGRALGVDRADPRRLLDGRDAHAGDLARDPEVGAARDLHRHAHRHRRRLDHAGGRRDGGIARAASASWC